MNVRASDVVERFEAQLDLLSYTKELKKYPIQKKKSGFYHFLEFTAPGEAIAPVEVEFKRDERIMRFLTVRMDKYAIEYAAKRRAKKNA